jgi:carbonic anhydrase/acetyltransferase-like protein (isoleucine patch superfamily)
MPKRIKRWSSLTRCYLLPKIDRLNSTIAANDDRWLGHRLKMASSALFLLNRSFVLMAQYQLGDLIPTVDDSAYIAPGATVIGDVHLKARSSVWPGAVLRGDNDPIILGEASNIQEGAVCHTDAGAPLTIGNYVTVGHQAMLHGCTIGDGSLIGIQAVVLNHAVIGKECLVGAGAIVTEGKTFPDRSLILGAPARVVRQLTDEDVARLRRGTESYAERQAIYKTTLKRID